MVGGSYGGIGISLSGMTTAQAGIAVSGQNIANANTEGYTRRVVTQAADEIVNNGIGIVMRNGVVIDDISRVRDFFLDQQYRTNSTNLGYSDQLSDIMVEMNKLLGEPSDNAIGARLSDLFDAASDLGANPNLDVAKINFVNAAKSLTNTINNIDANMAQLSRDMTLANSGAIDITISNINAKLAELAEVHQQVLVQHSNTPDISLLEDKRDLLLDELSEMFNFTINRDAGGDLTSLQTTVSSSQAKVTGTVAFTSADDAISPAILQASSNNTLTMSVNNGNGTSTGPFTVNFDDNSTPRDVVTKINETFRAAGGQGSIASLDSDGYLVLQTDTITGSVNSDDAEIDIDSGSALTALGLTAATTNGSDAETITLVSAAGLAYTFDAVEGNNTVGINSHQLQLLTNDGLQTSQGTIDNFSGKLGAYYDSVNEKIPSLRGSLNDFAMNLKDTVNKLMNLGLDESGSAGPDLFSGTHAGNIQVSSNLLNDPSLINTGHSGATGDGSIADAIADAFFDNNTNLGDRAKADQLYIDSSSSSSVLSTMPVIPGESIKIDVSGLITDGSDKVNAGTNGFGGGSLVQLEFLDSDGTVLGTTANLSTTSGPPTEIASYSGTIPTDAAYVQFKMNASFNDSDLTDNEGYFSISVYQDDLSASKTARNFNTAFTEVVGDFAKEANFAQQSSDIDRAQLEQVYNRRESIHGVSLEEEAANLIKYQTAFQASARVMNIVDEMLQELMAIML